MSSERGDIRDTQTMRQEFTASGPCILEEFGYMQLEGEENVRPWKRIRTLQYSQGSGMSTVSKQDQPEQGICLGLNISISLQGHQKARKGL